MEATLAIVSVVTVVTAQPCSWAIVTSSLELWDWDGVEESE